MPAPQCWPFYGDAEPQRDRLCAHVPARTTNSVRDQSDDLPGWPPGGSVRDGSCAEQLLQCADETTPRVDVELGWKPEHLLAYPQVDGTGTGVLAH